MRGVILAAGKGTRLGALGAVMPKALLPVGKIPCLEHIILGMKEAGVQRFAVVIGHLGEMIQSRYGDGSSLGVEITYLQQDLAKYGTGAAVLLAEEFTGGEPFFVSYGDIALHPANYPAMAALYREHQTMVSSANWVADPTLGAAVYLDERGFLERLVEKPPRGTSATNWNNAGVYILLPQVFDYLKKLTPSARGEYELTAAVTQMAAEGVPIMVHRITGFWQDVGNPGTEQI